MEAATEEAADTEVLDAEEKPSAPDADAQGSAGEAAGTPTVETTTEEAADTEVPDAEAQVSFEEDREAPSIEAVSEDSEDTAVVESAVADESEQVSPGLDAPGVAAATGGAPAGADEGELDSVDSVDSVELPDAEAADQ